MRFRSPVARQALVDHPPFQLDNDRFVRFVPHDEGINFRAIQGFHRGWVMIVGIPLDYRRTQYIADAINTLAVFITSTRMILCLFILWRTFLFQQLP